MVRLRIGNHLRCDALVSSFVLKQILFCHDKVGGSPRTDSSPTLCLFSQGDGGDARPY